MKPLYRILKFFVIYRVWILIISCLSNYFFLSYDESFYLVYKPYFSNVFSKVEKVLLFFFEPMMRWDGLHFFSITINGYKKPLNCAFLPGFPIIVRIFSNLIYNICFYKVSLPLIIIIVGIITSNLFFIGSLKLFFDITELIFSDSNFAIKCVYLYIIAPGTIYLLSFYSESSYNFFFFLGLFNYLKENYWRAIIPWFIASLIRSNGITNAGFIIYNIIHKKKNILERLLQIIIIIIPYLGFNFYCWNKFENYTNGKCSIINFYSNIQKKYWNFGLLKYYELNQIPNFIIATPYLMVIILSIYILAKEDFLGFLFFWKSKKKQKGYDGEMARPIFYYTIFHLIVIIFFSNVQIITRYSSSILPLYWYIVIWMEKNKNFLPIIILTSLNLIHNILFSLFFPPA